jgi:hypothetical protein
MLFQASDEIFVQAYLDQNFTHKGIKGLLDLIWHRFLIKVCVIEKSSLQNQGIIPPTNSILLVNNYE